jgi:hypothetical protein
MFTQINWPFGLISTAALAWQRCRDPSTRRRFLAPVFPQIAPVGEDP